MCTWGGDILEGDFSLYSRCEGMDDVVFIWMVITHRHRYKVCTEIDDGEIGSSLLGNDQNYKWRNTERETQTDKLIFTKQHKISSNEFDHNVPELRKGIKEKDLKVDNQTDNIYAIPSIFTIKDLK